MWCMKWIQSGRQDKNQERARPGGCDMSMLGWSGKGEKQGGWQLKGRRGGGVWDGKGKRNRNCGLARYAVWCRDTRALQTLSPSCLPNTTHVQETALNLCASRRLHNQRGRGVQEWWCERPHWRQLFLSSPLFFSLGPNSAQHCWNSWWRTSRLTSEASPRLFLAPQTAHLALEVLVSHSTLPPASPTFSPG